MSKRDDRKTENYKELHRRFKDKVIFVGFIKRSVAKAIDFLLYFICLIAILIVLVVSTFSIKYNVQEIDYFNSNCSSYHNLEKDKICKSFADFVKLLLFVSLIFTGLIYIISVIFLTRSNFEASLGKKILGLRVLDSNLQRISLIQAVTREIFWIFFLLSFALSVYINIFYLLQVILILFIVVESTKSLLTDDGKAIHDDLADTLVVQDIPDSFIKSLDLLSPEYSE